MLVNSKQILIKARKAGYAIGQFNTSSIETARAIFGAAVKLKSPVIIATSEKEAEHLGVENIAAVVGSFAAKAKVPIILHLDHGKDFNLIKQALLAGYTSIHFDGSELPFLKNINLTRKVVAWAKKFGASVEGEVGHIRSHYYKEEKVELKEQLTNPEQALEFVRRTRVNSLAIAIGTVHGACKGKMKLDFKRLKLIANIVRIPLVLHGASLLSSKNYHQLIKNGISKININTELRLALISTIKKVMKNNPGEYIPYKIFGPAIPEIQRVVEEKIKIFGSKNKA